MPDDWIEVGRVRSVHARAREVRVQVLSGSAYVFGQVAWIHFQIGPERPLRCKVLAARMDADVAIVRLGAGVPRDTVGQLRGARALLAPGDMPPQPDRAYCLEDLMGLAVVQPDGTVLGTVEAVYEGPANDAFAVGRPDGSQCMLPAIEAVIETIDLERREIRVGDIAPYVVEA